MESSSWLLLLGGCITFPGLLFVLQHLWYNTVFGCRVRKMYQFSDKECANLSVKIVSTFQAILASISGIIVCFKCSGNVLHCSDPITTGYAWFGIPYFIYDTFAMFYASRISRVSKTNENWIVKDFVKFILKSPIIVIHHMILAPIGFSLVTFGRHGISQGDFFVGIIYLMEISTPFVSMRFVLSKFKLKSSLLYILNGVIMLTTFPIFRIGTSLYAVQLYAQQNGLGYFEAFWNIPLFWKLIFLAAIAPQIYWYMLMCRGLLKIIRSSKSQSRDPLKRPTEKSVDNQGITCHSEEKQD